jgi:hypothetical protein
MLYRQFYPPLVEESYWQASARRLYSYLQTVMGLRFDPVCVKHHRRRGWLAEAHGHRTPPAHQVRQGARGWQEREPASSPRATDAPSSGERRPTGQQVHASGSLQRRDALRRDFQARVAGSRTRPSSFGFQPLIRRISRVTGLALRASLSLYRRTLRYTRPERRIKPRSRAALGSVVHRRRARTLRPATDRRGPGLSLGTRPDFSAFFQRLHSTL